MLALGGEDSPRNLRSKRRNRGNGGGADSQKKRDSGPHWSNLDDWSALIQSVDTMVRENHEIYILFTLWVGFNPTPCLSTDYP